MMLFTPGNLTTRAFPFVRCSGTAFRLLLVALLTFAVSSRAGDLTRLQYNNPGLTVDLAVGLWAWPVPMDFNGDGRLDLVISCPDKPSNGAYFFENTGHDVFKPGVRISKGIPNVSPSYVDGRVRALGPGEEFPDFAKSGVESPVKLPLPANIHPNKVRANQWRYVDFDGDGKIDIVVGVEDWTEYGWDNAYDAAGKWTHGPLHGFVYLLRNKGTNEKPDYEAPVKIEADGKPIDVFGMPSPCFEDFRGAGKLDLICGEFLDGFTFFENIGTRTEPKYARGKRLAFHGEPLRMDLEMIVVTVLDWNHDGRIDLVVGQEDGRVAWLENTGRVVDGAPEFSPPKFFQQQADSVKFGALATPVGVDWDGDGLEDIVCGNSAGYIGFIKNLGGNPPKWAAPVYLQADGKPIRIMAGPNGSIQGPAEAKWGYTTLSVADWDGDGLPDLVVNSIWGKVVWFRNIGTRAAPKLAAAQPIEVEWDGAQPALAWGWLRPEGKALLTQWRTTPVVVDWNKDGLMDLIMLDHEGYLAFFERARRDGKLVLLPPRRVFCDQKGNPLRFNTKSGGLSGRRKMCLVDWDGDGALDILINSANAEQWKQVGQGEGKWLFKNVGNVDTLNLAGHDTSPTVVHWEKDGIPDLLIGAEDGHFYFKRNPRHAKAGGAAQ
jgi:VCBS repeat protein